MNRSQLIFFSVKDLIELYLGFYNQEYGNRKGLEIMTKIQSSKRIQDFITKLRNERLTPGDEGFITIVNSLPYFFLSKGETLGYGAIFAIYQWIEASSSDSFKLNEVDYHRIVVETIYRAARLSGSVFFNKYFNLLDRVLDNMID